MSIRTATLVTAAAVLTLTAGCGATSLPPAYAGSHAPSPPPQPGPVSSQATLSSNCEMGYYPTGQGAVFIPGPPQNQVFGGTTYYPIVGYRVTFTNTGTPTADIAGWVVAFYDTSGTELRSDQHAVADSFLTAGQSFQWTEYAPVGTNGGSDNIGSDQAIPADGSAATCQVIQWYAGR